jgi:predicted RNA binding protein YcfA (HicA-like mRNA interferase family)
LKPLKFRDIITVLKSNGFVEDRVRGSHAQYKATIGGIPRLVTVQTSHLNDEPTRKTFASIVRTSGLPASAFRS